MPVRSSRKLLRLRRRRRRRLLRVAPERDFSTPVSESRSNKEREKKKNSERKQIVFDAKMNGDKGFTSTR